MGSIVQTHGAMALNWARKATLGLVEKTPSDKFLAQPWPGANHVLWNLGHIATVDDFFLATVTGQSPKLPAEWKGLFFMGSTPQASAAAYPAVGEIMDGMEERRSVLLDWFGALPESVLGQPTPEPIRDFAATLGVLPLTIAWHEGLHGGQISAIRRALGLEPAFG